jgi:hypothetical protein
MHPRSKKIKLIAFFLVTFVCLNTGGAVCLVYCQKAISALAAAPDHCPMKRAGSHCDPANDTKGDGPSLSVSGTSMECCPMTVTFVGAPIEKRAFAFERTATALLAPVPQTATPLAGERVIHRTLPAYRGPPLDRRADRVKQRVIRI